MVSVLRLSYRRSFDSNLQRIVGYGLSKMLWTFLKIFLFLSAKEYDYIIVGAGTAGCIVANRLSEDPSVKVLLLEAGGSDSNIADIPQAVFMLQETAIDWKFRTVPQKYACYGLEKNRMKWPR